MEEVEAAPILPLKSLHTDILWQQPEWPDTSVGCSDQGDGNPTIYVSARPRLGLFPFRCEAAVYAFKCSLRLHTKYTFHRDYEGG